MINKQCMEEILKHLTKLINLLEYEEIDKMEKLVDMARYISAQLIGIQELENHIAQNEDEEDLL